MHCDYGHAYLTCTIWSPAKRLRQSLFYLTFWYFSLSFSVCILHHFLSFLLGRCIEKKKSEVKWLPFFNILENVSTFSEKKKLRSALFFDQFFTSYCFVTFALSLCLVSILLVFSWPGQVSVQNCSSRGFSGILGKFLRVNLHLFWYGGRGRVASEERVGESQT